jgi:pimeloyl-ACP methyl ester carboxylesterase
LGGYIAQHLPLQHPQRVRCLILAGTGPGKEEGTRTSIRRYLTRCKGLHPVTDCSGSSLNRAQRARRPGRPTGSGYKGGKASAIRCFFVTFLPLWRLVHSRMEVRSSRPMRRWGWWSTMRWLIQ